ncbi:hypothetical protein Tco_0843841 [Tanacetum coccineum]
MLSFTGVQTSTSASGLQPSGNTKRDKIQRTPNSTQKNKVEAHPRTVKSSLKNKNSDVEPKRTANVQHSKLNVISKPLCVKCNGCMLSDNYDLYVLDFINNVNARKKSKSVNKSDGGEMEWGIGESLSKAWTHFKDLLQKVPRHGIDLWLQVQIFYDRIDHTLKKALDYATGGPLRKISTEKAWNNIEELAQYEREGWNDPIFPKKGSLNYENANMELSSNKIGHLPPEPSHQEAFEGLVMNFILDQEKKVRQLEEYMGVIRNDFMQLSLEVVKKLREAFTSRTNPVHVGVHFRLGGKQRSLSLVELGWRISLYSKAEGGENSIVFVLQNVKTIKQGRLILEFWSTIVNGVFRVGKTVAKQIRDPRIRLAHRCIAMIVSGCKDSTQRVTMIDLFYLYCVYGRGVICNIPYWLACYLSGIRDKSMVYGDQLIRRIHQLDTTYQPFYSEQRIDLCSLNKKTKIEIGDEFVKILQDNAFNGIDGGDVIDHIAKILEILEWIKIPDVDKDQLRLHVFLISLSERAKEWLDNEIKDDLDKGTNYLEFLEWLESKFKNHWNMDKNTKNGLWNFYVNEYNTEGSISNTEPSKDECDEPYKKSPRKTCSDSFLSPIWTHKKEMESTILKEVISIPLQYQFPSSMTSIIQMKYANPRNSKSYAAQ